MAVVAMPYIDVDERGVARIAGTRMKIKFLGIEHSRLGYTPEQIREAHPHLTMAQIHAGLAYYFEHQCEIDAAIAEGQRVADEMRAKAGPNPFVERMRREGLLPHPD